MLQSCLTFCNPVDHSLPGSSVHGILQARLLWCFWKVVSDYLWNVSQFGFPWDFLMIKFGLCILGAKISQIWSCSLHSTSYQEAHDIQLLLIRDVVWSPGHDTWFSHVVTIFPFATNTASVKSHFETTHTAALRQTFSLGFQLPLVILALTNVYHHSCNSFSIHQPAFSCWVLSSLPSIYHLFIYLAAYRFVHSYFIPWV